MSWESTIVYYKLINQEIQRRLGGVHSARILMHSFDFADIVAQQSSGDWEASTDTLIAAGQGLARAGADLLLICTNTMHLCAGALQKGADLPVLHIADPLGEAIKSAGLKKVGLLGTRFTMTRPDVLRARLEERYGIEIVVPEEDGIAEVHRVIYEELCCGRVLAPSRARYCQVIEKLAEQGAEGIVLGCTEIPLLIGQNDVALPLFDTTALHAMAAVEAALSAG